MDLSQSKKLNIESWQLLRKKAFQYSETSEDNFLEIVQKNTKKYSLKE